jgi:dihydropteroate synthase
MTPSNDASNPARKGAALRIGTQTLPPARLPRLMGVVNVTPDSFSDGGRWLEPEAAVSHALGLVEAGADLLDIGGESSRPGAARIPVEEEQRRIVPVLRALRPQTSVPLSIDTTKAAVARTGLDLGCDLVNDISGLRFDAGMLPLLATSQCSVVLMHMAGEPRTMQVAPHYDDVAREVGAWLQARLDELEEGGVDPERVLVDPGIGFGKRFSDNLELLRQLGRLRTGGRPLLVGASRKAFLGWLLDEPDPEARIAGDLAIAAWCREVGVEVLRVHDVRSARRMLRVLDTIAGKMPPPLDPPAPPARG